MPSPPLAPDDGPIDTGHLDQMTLGDASLEREVLAMFSAQAAGLIGKLATLPSDAAGTRAYAEGLGARDRGVCASPMPPKCLEAAIRNGDDPAAGAGRTRRCRRRGAGGHRRDSAPVLTSRATRVASA